MTSDRLKISLSQSSPPIGRFASRYVQFLSERSIVDRVFGRIVVLGRYPFRDHVDVLEHDALGMFFYNQRALFFAFAGIFLLITGPIIYLVPGASDTTRTAWIILTGAWCFGGALTLILHHQFRTELERWAAAHRPLSLPPIYDKYFLIDCALLTITLVLGAWMRLPFGGVAFLLCANIILYSAYTFIGYSSRLTRTVLIGLFMLALLFLPLWVPYDGDLVSSALTALPVAVMLLVTLFSVTTMSALSTVGHRVTRIQLALLGHYQNVLLGDAVTQDSQAREPSHSEEQFKKRLRSVLRDLCNRHHEFWYKSSVVWFAAHHDDRGKVFLLGPYENVTGLGEYRSGVDAASGFLAVDEVLLVHSLKAQVGDRASAWRFQLELDAPAALVPLRRGQEQVGALLLYGDEHSPPVPREDEQFLASLSSIVVNSWDQWRAAYSAAAHNELDQLFVCERLDDLFPAAVRVLAKYLFAAGCMLVYRPNPLQDAMYVAAATGFSKNIVGAPYRAGEGQTGKCASLGTVIRVDSVDNHREAFDGALLQRLEQSHGKPIKAWMAIPIGRPPRNYGVVKIVNRTEGPNWFTREDERLAEDLAIRLQITIEKVIQFAHTEAAKNDAQHSADMAKRAQTDAEASARERLQDLMTITHQMQGPLAGVIGALTGIATDLPVLDRDLLDHAQALVEDAITVGYGTFTTFALEAGRSTAFFENEIDAARELRELATRIQRTNPRPEIEFVYKQEAGFPTLRFDGRVFTSVLYSLIHNAIKYADDNTAVHLECSYERLRDEPAVKVKSIGAPIYSSERSKVFERFGRGRSVEHGKLYSGVGLGLWVARRLMRALDGDLTLELSSEDVRFSVFVVHFPVGSVKGH